MKLSGANGLKIQKTYEGVINKPFDINGILQEKDRNKVKVNVGNKTVEAMLKNKIDAKVGDHVTIDRSQIISMKICEKSEEVDEKKQKTYDDLLKSYGIETNKESLNAVEALQKYEVPLNKENVKTLMATKDYLNVIQQNLTYDFAVKLKGENIDLSEISLDKVADKIEDKKEEEETFSLLKFIKRKKEMKTEDAEKIAKKIYGSRMGKDITDIIKALYKEEAAITKKNIDEIHDVFYKLGKIEKIDDYTLVKVCKEDLLPTIENLYNTKLYVKEGEIQGHEDSPWIANVYEDSLNVPKTTEMDIKRLEESIRINLEKMDLPITEENIELAKEFIRDKGSLTKENIEKIIDIKKAIDEIIEKLDIEKVAELIKKDIPIQKIDIRELVDVIENTEESIVLEEVNKNEVEKILKKLDQLKSIKDKDLIKLLKMDADFQINKIEKIVFGEVKEENREFKNYADDKSLSDQAIKKGLNRVGRVSEVFQKVKSLNFNSIAFHLSKGRALTLNTIGENPSFLEGQGPVSINPSQKQHLENYIVTHEKEFKGIQTQNTTLLGAGRALLQNSLQLNIPNMQYVLESYGQYSRIRKNLSTSMVMDSVKEGKDIEAMSLKKLDEYVSEKTVKAMERSNDSGLDNKNEKHNPSYSLTKMVKNISRIGKEIEDVLPLLMKNEMDLSLKEVENVSLFLKNQEQLGQKIGQLIQMVGAEVAPDLKRHVLKIERLSKEISEKLKEGIKADDSYYELVKNIEEMAQDMSFSDESKEHMEDLRQSLRIQKKLNRKDLCKQFPVAIGEQFKNLQVWMPNKNIKGIDESLNVLLNLDTNNLGQTHIALKIEKKEIHLTLRVKEKEQMKQLEKHAIFLKEMLQEEGYTLKKLSFVISEEENLLKGMEEGKGKGLLNFII